MRKFLTLSICIASVHCQANRSETLICFGDEFVTRLLAVLLERNRVRLAMNEPNTLGRRVENIGAFVLRAPRAFNLSKTTLHGTVTVDCITKPLFAKIRLPILTPGFVFIYDYVFPGHLAYGNVVISSDKFGQIFYLEVPLQPRSSEKQLITDIEIYQSDDFKISFSGLGPVTRALSSVIYAAYRLAPNVPIELYKSLTKRVLQQYIDDASLPL